MLVRAHEVEGVARLANVSIRRSVGAVSKRSNHLIGRLDLWMSQRYDPAAMQISDITRVVRHNPLPALGTTLLGFVVLGVAGWFILSHSIVGGDVGPSLPIGPASIVRHNPPRLVPLIYKPLTKDQAIAENDEIPFSKAPIEKAPPYVLPVEVSIISGRRSSLDCLTSTIYYEAAHEPDVGKRAVAQVVLNRARHPAFPSSVCGVVYQGSDRRTGCQFTFTCDGSLARRPTRKGWEEARTIATSALSGAVEPSVGMATHYHASYVVPYWAPSLDKIVKLGVHIFYRWRGGWGKRRAFDQAISSGEMDAVASSADDLFDVELGDEDTGLSSQIDISAGAAIRADDGRGSLIENERGEYSDGTIRSAVRADEASGTLHADSASSSLKID